MLVLGYTCSGAWTNWWYIFQFVRNAGTWIIFYVCVCVCVCVCVWNPPKYLSKWWLIFCFVHDSGAWLFFCIWYFVFWISPKWWLIFCFVTATLGLEWFFMCVCVCVCVYVCVCFFGIHQNIYQIDDWFFVLYATIWRLNVFLCLIFCSFGYHQNDD